MMPLARWTCWRRRRRRGWKLPRIDVDGLVTVNDVAVLRLGATIIAYGANNTIHQPVHGGKETLGAIVRPLVPPALHQSVEQGHSGVPVPRAPVREPLRRTRGDHGEIGQQHSNRAVHARRLAGRREVRTIPWLEMRRVPEGARVEHDGRIAAERARRHHRRWRRVQAPGAICPYLVHEAHGGAEDAAGASVEETAVGDGTLAEAVDEAVTVQLGRAAAAEVALRPAECYRRLHLHGADERGYNCNGEEKHGCEN